MYYVFNANISFTFQAIKNLSGHPAYQCFGPFWKFFGDFLIYLEINSFSDRISKIYGNRKFWRFGVVLKLKFEIKNCPTTWGAIVGSGNRLVVFHNLFPPFQSLFKLPIISIKFRCTPALSSVSKFFRQKKHSLPQDTFFKIALFSATGAFISFSYDVKEKNKLNLLCQLLKDSLITCLGIR